METFIMVIAAAQVGIVLAVSVMILIYYARHRSMVHIVIMSASYILLTVLTAGSVIFKVFADEDTRPYMLVAAVIAFALGDFALWKVWNGRYDFRGFERRIFSNEERLTSVEAKLETLPGTEDDPMKVEIVNVEKIKNGDRVEGESPKVENKC